MTSETVYLDNHSQGLGRLLGIRFSEAQKERVVAEVRLGPEHLTEFDAVQGGVLMATADVTGAYGAVLNLPEGSWTATLEAKSNFLRRGTGNMLRAESTPIHRGQTTSVWRTRLFRGQDTEFGECIAEVIQTQLNFSGDRTGQKDDAPGTRKTDENVEQKLPPGASEDSATVISLPEARKQQILKGASRVITRKGFAKASVREIAEASRMPIATMYKYIRSKEDILEMIYENFLVEISKRIDSKVSDQDPPEKQLRHAIEATIATFDKYHDQVKLLFRETKSLNLESRERVYRHDQESISQWRRILEQFGREKRLQIDDPELVANFVYYLCTVWAMRHWAIGKYGYETVSRSVVRFVMAALGVRDIGQLEESGVAG